MNSALYPLIGQITFASGIETDDTPETKLDKLEALIEEGGGDIPHTAPLLADLLSIQKGERYPPLNYSPQRQREETLNMLMAQFAGLSRSKPTLAIYEDVHWVDPTTQELLDMVVEGIGDLNALAIITFRPEYTPPWLGAPGVTSIPLSRLGKRFSAQITANVAGNLDLPEDVLADIAAKTEGVPLFIEELTKATLEQGPCAPDSVGNAHLQVPATLKDSLAARLDRLGSAREVAQIGAVLGRTFSHELLAALSNFDANALDEALRQLTDAEILNRRGTPPDAAYTFKHALIQDAAYESLLKTKRRELHARVAETLKERFPESAETQPELLAHHRTEAGQFETGIQYWHKAADRALRQSANDDAISHAERGISLIGEIVDEDVAVRLETPLQATLGPALMATRGYNALETGKAYYRALELCEQAGDTDNMFPVLFGLEAYHLVRTDFKAAQSFARRFDDLAGEVGAPSLQMIGRLLKSTPPVWMGQFEEARQFAAAAVEIDEREHPDSLTTEMGENAALSARGHLAFALGALGYPDQARSMAQLALTGLEGEPHAHAHGSPLVFSCLLYWLLRDGQSNLAVAERLGTLANEQRFGLLSILARSLIAGAMTALGRYEDGLSSVQTALNGKLGEKLALQVSRSFALCILAEAYLGMKRPALALEALVEAEAFIDRTGEGISESECQRLRAQALLASDQAESAVEYFLRALDLARKRNARWFELRAARDLARLWHEQGKTQEARDLLAPIYGWFTEGFDTPDLIEAKALLDELRV